jgi:hypothetical protein
MNIAGNYVRITKSSGAKTDRGYTWMVPYSTDATISTQQQFIQPIVKVFEEMKNAIIATENNLDLSTVAAVTKFTTDMSDMFGVKLFAKDFYSSAWAGEEPATITLKLDFFRGMNNDWNAKTSVYFPILDIMKQTVPDDITQEFKTDFKMSSPSPSAIDVFLAYGTGIVDSFANSVKNTVATALLKTIKAQQTSNNITTSGLQKAIASGKLWEVAYGWSNDGKKINNPYLTFDRLIVEGSSFSFSPQLAKGNNSNKDTYYPISGSLDLSFKTQQILTSMNFHKGSI